VGFGGGGRLFDAAGATILGTGPLGFGVDGASRRPDAMSAHAIT
jgi:hypothetical protein